MRRGSLAATLALLLTVPLLPATDAYAATPAFIRVSPVPAIHGQQISVVGNGFCGANTCSAVTLSIDGQTVGSAVKVGPDGGFTTSLAIGVVPGDHDLTATQHTPDVDRTATAHLIVLPADLRTTPPAGHTPPPATNAPAGATGRPTPGDSTTHTDQQRRAVASSNAAVATTSTSDGGANGWWIAVGALILLAAAATGAWIWRRRHTTPPA